jgi:hypothetical protein
MRIAWLYNFGQAWDQNAKKSRLVRFLSLVVGFSIFGAIMYVILTKSIDFLASLVQVQTFVVEMTLAQLAFSGAMVGAAFGLVCFFGFETKKSKQTSN